MKVTLVMFKVDGTRRDYTLTRAKTIIGRTMHSDIRIPLCEISRRHCEIRITPKDVILRDLGSCNGTFHNCAAIKNAKLHPGDEIVVGPVIFTVVIDGEPTHIYPRRTLINRISKPTKSDTTHVKPVGMDLLAGEPVQIAEDDLPSNRLEFDSQEVHIEPDQLDRHRRGASKTRTRR